MPVNSFGVCGKKFSISFKNSKKYQFVKSNKYFFVFSFNLPGKKEGKREREKMCVGASDCEK
jgi:hypothetical protein